VGKKSSFGCGCLGGAFAIVLFIGGGIAIVAFIAAGMASSGASSGSAPSRLTLDHYNALHDGESYAAVSSELGGPGEEQARNHMQGVEGVMPSLTTTQYVWEGNGGANIIVQFQNDRLVTKAQFGLR
jgi:hypothetical protein